MHFTRKNLIGKISEETFEDLVMMPYLKNEGVRVGLFSL